MLRGLVGLAQKHGTSGVSRQSGKVRRGVKHEQRSQKTDASKLSYKPSTLAFCWVADFKAPRYNCPESSFFWSEGKP